jgi:ketosteroid isomerase-like protein
MDDAAALDVMKRFGKAFFKRDPALMEQAVTPDAEWHQEAGHEAPHGRVLRGVQGFLQGAAEDDAQFEKLRFNDVVIRGLGEDQIVMTYLAEGQARNGPAFSLRGIELLTVRDGRVAKKDVFWKQHKP